MLERRKRLLDHAARRCRQSRPFGAIHLIGAEREQHQENRCRVELEGDRHREQEADNRERHVARKKPPSVRRREIEQRRHDVPPVERHDRQQIQHAPSEIDPDQRLKRVALKRCVGELQEVHEDQRHRADQHPDCGPGGAHDQVSAGPHRLAVFPPGNAAQSNELDPRRPAERATCDGVSELVHQDPLEHDGNPDQQAHPALRAVECPEQHRHQPEPKMNPDRNSKHLELDGHKAAIWVGRVCSTSATITDLAIPHEFASSSPTNCRSGRRSDHALVPDSTHDRSR